MSFTALILLAVLVVAAAYALGRLAGGREAPAGPAAPPAAGRLAPPAERELPAVTAWLLAQAFEQTGVRVADDRIARARIGDAARQALQALKAQEAVTISLPFLTADASGPRHFEIRLTRSVIQALVRD